MRNQSFVLMLLFCRVCAALFAFPTRGWRSTQLPPTTTTTTRRSRRHARSAASTSFRRMATDAPSTRTTTTTTAEGPATTIKKQRRPPRPVFLTHERDFFRQEARLNSMDHYVLVSTLTASMSFGCLVGFNPHEAAAMKDATLRGAIQNSGLQGARRVQFFYRALCLAIQAVSGLSALFGLYATIIFSLTILYGKSALGAERDREYDMFLRRTVRARVNGARCFSLSLALFALEVVLVLLERTTHLHRAACSVPVGCTASVILYYLYKDWKLLFQSKEIIYRD